MAKKKDFDFKRHKDGDVSITVRGRCLADLELKYYVTTVFFIVMKQLNKLKGDDKK